MNIWDSMGSGKAGEFTKFEAGKPVVVHLLENEPAISKHQHWIGGKASECMAPNCQPCLEGVKRSSRYKIKVYNLTTKAQEVMESGPQVFIQIRDIRNAYEGDVSSVDFRIEKSGSGMDTEYKVVNIPTKFTADMVKAAAPDPDVPF